jgi:hydrogenase/urease accessory protein HupE
VRPGAGLLAGAALVAGVLAAGVLGAAAHPGGTTGYASIAISGNTVRYSLTLSASAAPSSIAEALAAARAGDAESRQRLLGAIRQKISLTAPGNRCEPVHGFMEPPRPDRESVALTVDFACAGRVDSLVIRDDLFDVFGPDHHTLARIEGAGLTGEFAFATETRQTRISRAPGGDGPGPGGFFALGLHHILTGYDHLLFLVALLLRGGTVLSLLKIVTAFTAAHSVTLALAVLGIVTLPDRLVEAVIAGSIVWVAVENAVLTRPPSWRWLVGFVFGLVHGFGFSSALGPLALPPGRQAWALLAFNLGVEAGQIAVIAVVLPGLVWLGRRPWRQRAVQLASLAVACAGLVWLIERVFLV